MEYKEGGTMRKLITALAVVTMLAIASFAFASAPATSKVIGHQPALLVLGQSGKISPASFAKMDIKTIGLLDSGQTYVLGTSAPDGSGASAAIIGAMDLGGSLGTIVQSSKSAAYYIVETKSAPMVAAATTTTGKTLIIMKTRTTEEEDHLAMTYAAEPHGSYVLSRTAAGTLALL